MLEDLISPDSQRELVSLLVPVKKRLPNPELFGNLKELDPDSIRVEEIEKANPILWTQDVPMDKLIPINHPHYRVSEQGEAVSACMFNHEGGTYLERIFDKCGYASTFVSEKQLMANKEMYIQTLVAYIDKGVPVVAVTHNGPPWGIYVGYEEYGKALLFLTGDKTEPERVPMGQVISDKAVSPHIAKGWLFVREKRRSIDLAQIYRDIIIDIPKLFSVKLMRFASARRRSAHGRKVLKKGSLMV